MKPSYLGNKLEPAAKTNSWNVVFFSGEFSHWDQKIEAKEYYAVIGFLIFGKKKFPIIHKEEKKKLRKFGHFLTQLLVFVSIFWQWCTVWTIF